MWKLFFHLFTVFVIANCQHEMPNGNFWQANEQQHPQQQPTPMQHAEEGEEMLGSPLLLPLKMKMALKNPLLFGIPGMRFSKVNMGRLGHLKYGNIMLGSENPFANEEPQLGSPHQGAEMEHHEANLGSPQQHFTPYAPEPNYHQFSEPQPHYHQADPNMGAPQHFHLAPPNMGMPQPHFHQPEPNMQIPQPHFTHFNAEPHFHQQE